LYALAALLMFAALFLTFSRGAWLLGVPASLLFIAALRGRRPFAVVLGILVVVLVLGILVLGPGRLSSVFDTSEGTTFFRLQLWRSSLDMISDHPLTGVGLDNFLYQYRSRYAMPSAWEELNLSHPHNIVMDVWLRLGLLGLAAMGWLLFSFFRKGLASYRRWSDGYGRLLMLGLIGGMVNFLAHGLVDNAYFLVDLAFTFSLMLAFIQLRSRDAQDSGTMPSDDRMLTLERAG
jgi:O-antigen ligase